MFGIVGILMIGPGMIVAGIAAVIVIFIAQYVYRANRFKQIKNRLHARGNTANHIREAEFPPHLQQQVAELQRLISKHTGIPVENIALDDDVWEDLGLRYQAPDAMGALVVDIERTFKLALPKRLLGLSLTLRKLIQTLLQQDHRSIRQNVDMPFPQAREKD